MWKKSVVILSSLLIASAAKAYVETPRRIVALTGQAAPATEQHKHTAIVEAHTDAPNVAANLDGYANVPHKQSGMASKAEGRRFICGPPESMQRNPNGTSHAEYGRVSRCEWM